MSVSLPPSMPFEADAPAVRRPKKSGAPSNDAPAGTTAWRDRPRWLRLSVSLSVIVASLALVASPWWGPLALSRLDFFHVRTIEFDGVRFAKSAELLQRLRLDTTQSVWQPLDTLAARVLAHPMVRNVQVERDLPGTIRVRVSERIPVAMVPSRGGMRPADATGQVLPIDPALVPLDIPLAMSTDRVMLSVLDRLRQSAPTLYARVSEARKVGPDEFRFTITGSAVGAAGPAMINSLIVRTTADVTVARFKDILPVEADLARNHLRAVELDLRFRDQVIARQP